MRRVYCPPAAHPEGDRQGFDSSADIARSVDLSPPFRHSLYSVYVDRVWRVPPSGEPVSPDLSIVLDHPDSDVRAWDGGGQGGGRSGGSR